jgi:hypothetical protein
MVVQTAASGETGAMREGMGGETGIGPERSAWFRSRRFLATCPSLILWGLRPVLFSVFHWQPVWSTKKASMAFQASKRGREHHKGCGLRGGSTGTRRSHNSSRIRQSRRAFS